MTTISGTYYNGKLIIERSLKTKKPLKVKITFEEESKTSLQVSDF
jgi:hypothetical protein